MFQLTQGWRPAWPAGQRPAKIAIGDLNPCFYKPRILLRRDGGARSNVPDSGSGGLASTQVQILLPAYSPDLSSLTNLHICADIDIKP